MLRAGIWRVRGCDRRLEPGVSDALQRGCDDHKETAAEHLKGLPGAQLWPTGGSWGDTMPSQEELGDAASREVVLLGRFA